MTDPSPPSPSPDPAPRAASAAPRRRRVGAGEALKAAGGGLADVLSRDVRGLLFASAGLALVLLSAAVWAALRFGLPLIPDWAGPWGDAAEIAATGAASVVAVVLALVLFPLVAMVVTGVFADVAADRIERRRLGEAGMGRAPSMAAGLAAGLRFAAVSIPVNLFALPFYFVPVAGLAFAVLVNAFLLSRENFLLASLRRGSFRDGLERLRADRGAILFAGFAPAVVVLIPIANMVVPLWTLAIMLRMERAGGEAPAGAP